MKLITYIENLSRLPILSWSYQGLYQTMVQDQKEDLTWALNKYLPLSFQGSLSDALWVILNHQDFKTHSSWKVHKKRILLGISKNEPDVDVPKRFYWRKKILLTLKAGAIEEQNRIQKNLFNFNPPSLPKDNDDDLPF